MFFWPNHRSKDLGLELWRRTGSILRRSAHDESADVVWSRVAAILAINRLCAPGSDLSIEQRWFPSTALNLEFRIRSATQFPVRNFSLNSTAASLLKGGPGQNKKPTV